MVQWPERLAPRGGTIGWGNGASDQAGAIFWFSRKKFAGSYFALTLVSPLIARCQEWARDHYAEATPVTPMVQLSGLSERTFIRRFTKATGMSRLDYIHALRLEEAKQILETQDLPVEAVALEVGYLDNGFFGRMLRRRVGMTPGPYHRRWGNLRTLLNWWYCCGSG